MSALGPEARALIDDAAGVDRSTSGDKERIRARLAVQAGLVAAGAAAAASTVSAAAAQGSAAAGASAMGAGTKALAVAGTGGAATVLKLLGGLGLAGVLVVGAVAVRRGDSGTLHASSSAMPAATAPSSALPTAEASLGAVGTDVGAVTASPVITANPALEPVIDPAVAGERGPRAAGSASPSLRGQHLPGVRNDRATAPTGAVVGPAAGPTSPTGAGVPASTAGASGGVDAVEGEARLLRNAEAAIAAGDGVTALALLDTHARRFPDGALAEQRDAERVVAMCTVGRVPAARAAAERYLAAHPRSSRAERVRRACGAP